VRRRTDGVLAQATPPPTRLSLLYVLDVTCSKLAQRNAPHPLLDAVQADLPALVAAVTTNGATTAADAPSTPARSSLQSVLKVA
jgi:hypothetical protein